CWARGCEGQIRSYQTICFPCKLAKSRLKKRRRNKATKGEDWLVNTPNVCLDQAQTVKKMSLVVKKHKEKQNRLKKELNAEIKKAKMLEKFCPEDKENRKAVLAVVKKLNEETSKVKDPTCKWRNANGQVCNFKTHSINLLNVHIREQHLIPQLQHNKSLPVG